MSWLELRLVVQRTHLETASQALFDQGASGVQEDFLPGEAPPVRQPWDRGPLPPLPARVLLRSWWEPDQRVLLEPVLDTLLQTAVILTPAQWVDVQDVDWASAWRKGFTRLEISSRLTVAPPWEAKDGDLVIEPGMAFGTGEHPTTRACLEAIDRLSRPGARLLDIGCGTGVLALAGAHLGMDVRGIDTDPEAVRASLENAERNGLQGHFDQAPLQDVEGHYDLVVANLYAEVLVDLAPFIEGKVGGSLVLAGVLQDRIDRVTAAMSGLEHVASRGDGDWVCLEYRR